MEYGQIERELRIDASPEVVYEVVSSPEHLREWWPDDAVLEPTVGSTGRVTFGDPSSPEAKSVVLKVVEAEPPHRFSFRWVYDGDDVALSTSSLLVTFEMTSDGAGTLLRFTEQGFREKGWEAAVLEEQYREHAQAWDYFFPRLVAYAASVGLPR